MVSILTSGRSPGAGNVQSQYSCLENTMNTGGPIVCGVAKESDMT